MSGAEILPNDEIQIVGVDPKVVDGALKKHNSKHVNLANESGFLFIEYLNQKQKKRLRQNTGGIRMVPNSDISSSERFPVTDSATSITEDEIVAELVKLDELIEKSDVNKIQGVNTKEWIDAQEEAKSLNAQVSEKEKALKIPLMEDIDFNPTEAKERPMIHISEQLIQEGLLNQLKKIRKETPTPELVTLVQSEEEIKADRGVGLDSGTILKFMNNEPLQSVHSVLRKLGYDINFFTAWYKQEYEELSHNDVEALEHTEVDDRDEEKYLMLKGKSYFLVLKDPNSLIEIVVNVSKKPFDDWAIRIVDHSWDKFPGTYNDLHAVKIQKSDDDEGNPKIEAEVEIAHKHSLPEKVIVDSRQIGYRRSVPERLKGPKEAMEELKANIDRLQAIKANPLQALTDFQNTLIEESVAQRTAPTRSTSSLGQAESIAKLWMDSPIIFAIETSKIIRMQSHSVKNMV